MKLTVPTTFTSQLLQGLEGTATRYVYGSLPEDSGGRPQSQLSPVDIEGLAAHVAQARSMGIGFSYILNSS